MPRKKTGGPHDADLRGSPITPGRTGPTFTGCSFCAAPSPRRLQPEIPRLASTHSSFSPVAQTSHPTRLPEMRPAPPQEPTLRARPDFLRPDAQAPRQPIDAHSGPPRPGLFRAGRCARLRTSPRAATGERASRQPREGAQGEERLSGRRAGAGGAHRACACRTTRDLGRGRGRGGGGASGQRSELGKSSLEFREVRRRC